MLESRRLFFRFNIYDNPAVCNATATEMCIFFNKGRFTFAVLFVRGSRSFSQLPIAGAERIKQLFSFWDLEFSET